MSDSESFGAFIAVCTLAFGVFSIGSLAGSTWEHLNSREKFIIYCTNKGDTFENCDLIWQGRKPKYAT